MAERGARWAWVAAVVLPPVIAYAMYERRGAGWALVAFLFYLGAFGAAALRPRESVVRGALLMTGFTMFALLVVTPWAWWVAALASVGVSVALVLIRGRLVARKG